MRQAAVEEVNRTVKNHNVVYTIYKGQVQNYKKDGARCSELQERHMHKGLAIMSHRQEIYDDEKHIYTPGMFDLTLPLEQEVGYSDDALCLSAEERASWLRAKSDKWAIMSLYSPAELEEDDHLLRAAEQAERDSSWAYLVARAEEEDKEYLQRLMWEMDDDSDEERERLLDWGQRQELMSSGHFIDGPSSLDPLLQLPSLYAAGSGMFNGDEWVEAQRLAQEERERKLKEEQDREKYELDRMREEEEEQVIMAAKIKKWKEHTEVSIEADQFYPMS
jgi:hypothetical protein